jgi:uncharacterized membrane protein
MIRATLNALTWGTVAAAVVSALLLAAADGPLRADETQAGPAATSPSPGGTSGRKATPARGSRTDPRH